MIDKRLLKEMPETKPYIMKQVAMQWFSLLCNIVFVALLANVLSHIFYKTVNEQLLLLTTCGVILCIALRAVCVRKASLYSHEASCHVREQLRMRLFKKLLEMKSGYTESAPTSELVQLSVEGIDQLEIYFDRYLPQFFYSMLAPVTLFLILVWMDVKVHLYSYSVYHSFQCLLSQYRNSQRSCYPNTGAAIRRWETAFWKICRVLPR